MTILKLFVAGAFTMLSWEWHCALVQTLTGEVCWIEYMSSKQKVYKQFPDNDLREFPI